MTDPSSAESLSPQLADLLGGGDELLDVVLRGHLHVEQLLLVMIEHWAVTTRYVSEARLSFNQKLYLARALNFHHPDEPIWSALSALNSLRNDFAHRLTSDQREAKVNNFIKLVNDDLSTVSKSANEPTDVPKVELLKCFSYLFGSLQSMGAEYSIRSSMVSAAGRITGPKSASSAKSV